MIDPFEILGLTPSLLPDMTLVDAQYRKMIKQYHPDRFGFDSEEHNAAVERTAKINSAYKLIGEKLSLSAYFLKSIGFEEGKDKMPDAFLMEMMDLNEAIAEAEMEGDESAMQKLIEEVSQFEASNEKEFSAAARAFDSGNTALWMELLKDSYLKMKYILRLKERLINFAPR
jgi:molecular chaperone HscB